MTDKNDGVLAVLERMRVLADYGRAATWVVIGDSDISAKEAIQQIDEDRWALTKVAELLAADEEYDAAWEDKSVKHRLNRNGGFNHSPAARNASIERIHAAHKRRASAIRAMRGDE